MYTSSDPLDLHQLVLAMRRNQISTGPADADLRRDRLRRAARLITENRDAITNALDADFGNRSRYQSLASDVLVPVKSLGFAEKQLESWMQPESVADPAPEMRAWIQYQPLGVVGIISPWNFPINLAFCPLAGAFAAGNTAVLKPSELTPRTSNLMAELVLRYFDPMELSVVLGDAAVGVAFSRLPFDHLIFTGSTAVGRQVMRAAAENLTPVTLELGGKSPVMIDQDADVRVAAQRILTIKTFNSGQICLAPDYVLLPSDMRANFVTAAREFVARTFPTILDNPDYTSIINARHLDRLMGLLDDARAKGATVISLAPAGEPEADAHSRKMAPILVLDAREDMGIMREEIFGPILPILTYAERNQAIEYIIDHPRPLAAYYFGDDAEHQKTFAAITVSGALVINDVMSHTSLEELPFGGVGPSGTGAYHGVYGFRRFSHAKTVVVQSEDGASNLRFRAPYADKLPFLEAALKA
jgi:coniferyl-aldehyde dehydrogenase